MGNSGDDFAMPTAFLWFFGAVVAVMVCIVVLAVVGTVRNRRVLREAGIDPATARAQFAVRMIRGQPASQSASSRLAELSDLRDRGLITQEEYDTRRSQIISTI
jgi:hypothetical protein